MNRFERFERQVLPHLDAAYNLARWLTRNDQDAQDVVQEAFTRALRYFDSLKDGDARAWLLATVRNTGYTWLEKNRPSEVMPLEDSGVVGSDPDSNPEVVLLQRAQGKLVNLALEELPVAYREVIVLRELEDLAYKEIAGIVGAPIGTVMSRLARGRGMLRAILERRMRKAS